MHTLHGKYNKIAIQTYNYYWSSIQCHDFDSIALKYKFILSLLQYLREEYSLVDRNSNVVMIHSIFHTFFISYNNLIIVFPHPCHTNPSMAVLWICQNSFYLLPTECIHAFLNILVFFFCLKFCTQSSGKTLFCWNK